MTSAATGETAEVLSDLVGRARIPAQHTFIGGEFGDGGGQEFEATAPAFGTSLATIQSTSPERVGQAAESAARAQPGWAAMAASARAQVLEHAADLIRDDIDRLATLVVLDNGKTLKEARGDVLACADLLRSAAGWATRVKGTTLPGDGPLVRFVWREPVGVVGVIMPFNAPLMFCGMKVAPALAMGNAVVAKAPEKSPIAPVAFAEHLVDAGLPPGVLNVVQGFAETGSALVEADEVGMVSFTGSNAVGASVGSAAAQHTKRMILELGGKSANIVYDDAPLEAAIDGAVRGIFTNAGQRCFSGSRILVQAGVAAEFVAGFVERARAIDVGNPFAADTDMGALITVHDVDRVDGLVTTAATEGGTVLCGGERPAGLPARGAYYAPTVIDATASPGLGLLEEEAFGPVVTVQQFESVDDAIALANDSRFGLAGGCWTASLDRALTTARAVDTGMFWVNSYGTKGGSESVLEARRGSGFGPEKGYDGALQYTTSKSVMILHGDVR